MDYDKLASSLGGSLLDNDYDKLATQFGGQLVQPPEPVQPPAVALSPEEQMMSSIGEGSGTELKDIGKLATASAVKSLLGSPEAIQAAGSGVARDTTFGPMEAVNYLADPRKLTNTLAGAVGMKPIFDEAKGPVPEEFLAKEKAAVDDALTKGKIESLRDLTKYGSEVSKMIEDTVSPEMKEALALSEPTGNIIKTLDQKVFGVPAGAEELTFGKAPSAMGLAGQAARVFGSVAPGVLTSFITKSATPGAAFGFGQAGSEGIDTAREHISKMSDIELARKSEYYRNLLLLGYPPSEARKMTEDKAADTAAYYQGITGALGGAFTGNLVAGKLDKLKLINAQNILGRIVQGGAVGMTEEGLQELMEGIATDLGINRTVVREIGVDSFANLVLGAIGGGGPGAVGGAVTKPEGEVQPAPTVPGGPAPMSGADTVRVYHGGNPEKGTGPLWGTTSLQDAEGWASRSPDMKVWYVDVPKNDPRIAQYMGDVQNGIAPSSRFELPQDLASKIKPLKTPVKMAEIKPEDLEEETPPRKPVTAVTPQEAPLTQKEKIAKLMAKRPNDPAVEAEGLALADELIKIGDTASGNGLKNNLERGGGFTKQDQLNYYKGKLLEAQQKAGVAEEMPKEKFGIDKYLDGFKADKKRFEEFIPNAPEEIKGLVNKSNQYLQEITDKINSAGYKVLDITTASPIELQNLKSSLSGIAGSTVSFAKNAEHIAKQNRFANPEKLQSIIDQLNKDFAEADQLLGREAAKPKATEVVEENRYSWANTHKPIVNPNEAELKAIDIYKKIKAENPDADLEDEISNPNVGHPIKEEPNPLGIKVGDLVYNKGDSQPRIAITVGEDSVKLINPKTGHGLFSQYDEVSKEPIGHDYHFDFGYGPLDVDVSKWFKDTNEWQFKIYGPGASESGFLSVIGPVFEGKRGTKEFEKFVEEVVKANTGKKFAKPKKPTKEEKVAANKARQEEKKAKRLEARAEKIAADRADYERRKAEQEEKQKTPEVKAKTIEKIKSKMVRFASGMSGLSDLINGSFTRAKHQNYGVGFDVGLLSKNAIKELAHFVVNMDTQVFVDSGAFSHFRKQLKGKDVGELDFDKILAKYDAITEAISEENAEEKQDYPRPLFVMPDVVGDQKASLDLIKKYAKWIYNEVHFNAAKPIIPIQKGELTLSEVFREIMDELNTNQFIVGIPSNAEAVSRQDLIEFLRESRPHFVHFLGAAADSKIDPLIELVAMYSPGTEVTADASKVRSAILNGVAKGKTRSEAIKDALYEEEDPMVVMNTLGREGKIEANKARQEEKKAKETHIEGKTSEPITSKTIEEAIDKAESNVDYNKIKTAVKNQFEQAIKRAKIQTEKEWTAATVDENSYVTIDIPGDGKFKVKNNVERLKELQTKIANAVTPKAPKLPSGPTSGAMEAFKSMVDEKDMENAIEYAKLKDIDIKTAKLTPVQRNIVDKYLKNPAEFERQKEESEQMAEARQEALRRDQDKRIAERLAADEEREEEARFKAVIDTTIASTEAQLKRDITAKKISTKDARRMVEVFPNYPEGTIKPYTIRLIEKRAGAEPSFKQLRKNITEDGQKLTHPLVDELVNSENYEMLDLRNPRTYVDKGGIPHRTFERNGVRMAFTLGEKLFQTKGKENQPPQTGIGTDKDVHFNVLLVDPQDRRQGKATNALNVVRFIADRHGLNVYLEPAELEKNGITKEQLTKLYSKFQFKPRNESGKIMLREPETYAQSMERINAEMKAAGREPEFARAKRELAETKAKIAELQAKKALADESKVIDVQAIEITPGQMKLLTNQVNKLSDADIATLEEHYGIPNYSDAFMKRIREDIINYTNKGAEAVNKAIRSIIAKLQAGLLSVAMVFNPAYMSQQSAVVYPTQTVTQQVTAAVPESAKAMSDSGKKAYANLYPALQQELQKNNKYFTVVDKPTSKVFVFNPDGSLMTQSNVVLGKALGDTYVGKTDFVQNRITPAGLFKPKAEKGSATYDGKTVYTLGNVKEGWNAVFMHTVYLKEADAEARKKALATGETTRLSHGCINGPSELMEKIDNDSMNESHVFIVPDNQAMTDAYISNNVSNEDLTRETVTPVTVTTKVPAKGARAIGSIDILGREEEAIVPRSQAEINQERQMAKLAQEKPYFNDFTNSFDAAQIQKTAPEIREETIKEYAKVRAATRREIRKVAKVGSDINVQRNLNELLAAEEALKDALDATKVPDNRAIVFRNRANQAEADGSLAPEVAAVIEQIYKRFPGVLEGLKLSIREEKQPSKSAGNFNPYQRIVTLWKGSSGVENPSTVRHELVHSLEQMMTPETKKAIVEAWAKSFQAAIKANPDTKSQEFFNKVMDFLENPSKESFDAATNVMPDMDFYQYMNPSEYWAVNAEKLFAAKLGTPWARFVNAIKRMFEALKSVLGFNNKYAIHKAFENIINGTLERTNKKEMLTDYLFNGKVKLDFLNSIEDITKENENVPEVPDTDPKTFKDMMIGTYNRIVENAKDIIKNPKNNTAKGLEKASEGVLYTRIKNVWFAAGLEARELAKYAGQIRTSEGLAIASLAVKNAIHAGSISTQVLIQGGLEYSEDFLQFIAVKRDHSMKNVAALQYDIRKLLGRKEGDKTINSYLVAKRARGIYENYAEVQGQLEKAIDDFNDAARKDDDEARTKAYNKMTDLDHALDQAIIAYQKIPTYLRQLDEDGETLYETVTDRNGQEYKLPVLDDDEIDKFISREKKYPQLAKILENFTAVNHNMIDMMVKSSRISAKEGERLKKIKGYVPWNRVMDESEELFDNRKIPSMPSNIKYFKRGETDRDIANIIDNMNHNVTMMTRSAIRNYAQVRIIQEFGRRKSNGKLQVYPSEGKFETGVRVPVFIAGRRVIVEIEDEMVAEAILGMIAPPTEIPLQKFFSATSQLLRRSITFSLWFQTKQVLYDAPTAAMVSGVKRPDKLLAGCFSGYIRAIASPITDDPVIQAMRSAGVGGFQSFHRTAKSEQEIELGMVRHSKFAFLLRAIDHIGDSSDYSQRIATYNQVLKETGDKALAMMQAADVIDFQKHGNGRLAQALRVSVTFMQAYATQLDVLSQSVIGGNIRGQERWKAAAKFHATGLALGGIMLLYAMMAAGDDDYHELDDETRSRNLYVPHSKKIFGHHVLIPLHSTAALFYKVLPEQIYYRVSTQGTANEMDKTRFWKVMGNAAVDMLLGPTPVPSGVKGGIEIVLDKNFYTGGKITPDYLKNLEAYRQFTASTSELGKLLSASTQIPFTGEPGKESKRMLSPIQADHLMRAYLGSMATSSMYFTDLLFNKNRPEKQMRENPLLGGLIGADVPRRNENLYYDLKERADKVYGTFQDLVKNDRKKAAEFREANIKMIQAHGYTSGIEQNLNQLNAQIRRLGRSEDLTKEERAMTPAEKRERINYFNQKKQEILSGIVERRKAAGL